MDEVAPRMPGGIAEASQFPRQPQPARPAWNSGRPGGVLPRDAGASPRSTPSRPGLLGQTAAAPLTPAVSPAAQPVTRSRQLESVAQEADRHSRRGFDLAGRKAYFAAQAEFVMALRLVAEGLDNEDHTDSHMRAFTAGLNALREAEDFLPTPDRVTADVDVPTLIRGHLTPVLKNAANGDISPLEAARCYFTFAQEQMGRASGQEVAGSMALHGLGKVYATLAGQSDSRLRACESKAVVYFQASLLAFPQNYMASNDLGVLLARCGYYGEARMALEHSIGLNRSSTGWHNLATVYRHLGQPDLARRAEAMYQAAEQAEAHRRPGTPVQSDQLVQWMDPQSFARSFAQTPDAYGPMPARTAAEPLATEAKPWGAGKADRKTLVMKPAAADPASRK